MSNCSDEPDILITLVHGTFAKNAQWTQEDSLLRKVLRNQLESFKIEFTSFGWSGSNSHRARYYDALLLGRHLRQKSREFPKADHFIIAHSHGGNLVLNALRRHRRPDKISGVVCLGTPFINFLSRESELIAFTLFLFFSPIIFCLSGWFCWFSGYVDNLPNNSFGNIIMLLSVFAPFVCPFILLPLLDLDGPIISRLKRGHDKQKKRFLLNKNVNVPFFCIKADFDEANMILSIVNKAVKISNWLRKFFGVFLVLEILFFSYKIANIVIVTFDAAGFFRRGTGEDIGGSEKFMVALLMAWILFNKTFETYIYYVLLGVLSFVLYCILGLPLQYVLSSLIRYAGYGRGIGRGSRLWFTAFQSTKPPGVIKFVEKKYNLKSKKYWYILNHSWLYSDPAVLSDICKWIIDQRASSTAGL